MIKSPSEYPDDIIDLSETITTAESFLDEHEGNGLGASDIKKLGAEATELMQILSEKIRDHADACGKEEVNRLKNLVYRFTELFGSNPGISLALIQANSNLELIRNRMLAEDTLANEELQQSASVG